MKANWGLGEIKRGYRQGYLMCGIALNVIIFAFLSVQTRRESQPPAADADGVISVLPCRGEGGLLLGGIMSQGPTREEYNIKVSNRPFKIPAYRHLI